MMAFKCSNEIYAHVDCNSFFASCEVHRNPSLKWKPVCVWDQICIAASYEAKKYWVKVGTPMWEAERIFGKNLVKIIPDHEFYSVLSQKLMSYVRDKIWNIEVFSVDEFFVNITNIWIPETQDDYKKLAEKIKQDIYKDIWLPVSVGIANTRIKAKIFSDLRKPFGTFVWLDSEVISGVYKALKVTEVPYIAKWSSERLWTLVKTISDFYNLKPMKVKEILGKNWFTLWLELHWVDVWKPIDTAKRQSIVCTRSFNTSMTSDYSILWNKLLENLERAYYTLLEDKQEVRVIGVMLKDKEFVRTWKHIDLWTGTVDRQVIWRAVRALFDKVYSGTKLYRTTWVEFSELSSYTPKQTTIFDIASVKHETNLKLAEAMKNLRTRYGKDVVHQWFVKKGRMEELGVLMEVG